MPTSCWRPNDEARPALRRGAGGCGGRASAAHRRDGEEGLLPLNLPDAGLIETLAPPERLALAYAPAALRGRWLALLALDARMGGVVRGAREPVLAQLKLAWWRDRLGDDPARWPKGEPLLALLRDIADCTPLAALVDGWEALLAAPPLGEGGLQGLAEARATAVSGLFGVDAGSDLTRGWGLAALVGLPLDPADRASLDALLAAQKWRPYRLPRALRPLLVLHHFAARAARGQGGGLAGAIRLGLLGR